VDDMPAPKKSTQRSLKISRARESGQTII